MRFSLGTHQRMPRTAWLVLLMALVLAAAEVPDRLRTVRSGLEIVRLWPDRVAQTRQVVGPELYDALTTVDQVLPRDAAILLVTAGTDVRHWEYTAFHRALYFLAPRPVWWAAPVERDGTWESRWWTPTVLSAEALAERARAVGATHVLSFGVARAIVPGRWMRDLPAQGGLSMLPEARPAVREAAANPTEIDRTWPLRLVAAIGVLVLAGHLVLERIAPPDLHSMGIQRLALDWLLGAGAVSLGMFWLGSLRVPLTAQVGILTGLVMAGALVLRPWRSVRIRWAGLSGPPAERWLIGGLLAWVCAEVGFVAVQAIGQPLRVWDSWVTWGMRARLIYLEGGIDPVLHPDLSRLVTRLSYPLLVPLTEAWTYTWLGALDDRFAGVQAVLFFVALLLLIFTAVRSPARSSQAPQGYALAVVVGLASITYLDRLAGVVFADVPLAAYTTAAALFLRRWLVHGFPADLVLAAALAGLMPWTKAEALFLLAALAVATLLTGRAGWRARSACLALGIAAVMVAGPWYAWITAFGVPEPAYQPFTWATFAANIGRLPRIVALLGARAVRPEWHALWVAVALAGIYLALARRSVRPLFLATAAFYLAGIALIFVFSDYAPLEAHILSSADRLMAHVAPLAVLWLAELPFEPHSVT